MSEIPAKLLEVIREPDFAERVSEACLKKAGDTDAEKLNRFHPFATISPAGDKWIIDRFRAACFLMLSVSVCFSVITGVLSGMFKGVLVGLIVGPVVGVVIGGFIVWTLIRYPESRRLTVTQGNRWVLDGADLELDKFSGFVVANVTSESWGKRAEYRCLVGVLRSGRVVPLDIGASVLLMRILSRRGYCVLDGREDLKNPVVRPGWA